MFPHSSESESKSDSESDSESKDDKPVGVLSSLTPEELEKLKEAVEEKKKLISTLKGKPWPMKKKLVMLRFVLFLHTLACFYNASEFCLVLGSHTNFWRSMKVLWERAKAGGCMPTRS